MIEIQMRKREVEMQSDAKKQNNIQLHQDTTGCVGEMKCALFRVSDETKYVLT